MIDITFKKVIRVMTSETTVLVENQASPTGTASVQNGGTVQTKEVNEFKLSKAGSFVSEVLGF